MMTFENMSASAQHITRSSAGTKSRRTNPHEATARPAMKDAAVRQGSQSADGAKKKGSERTPDNAHIAGRARFA